MNNVVQLLDSNSINYTIYLLIGNFNECEIEEFKIRFSKNNFLLSYLYPTNVYSPETKKIKEKLLNPKYRELSVNMNTYQILSNYNNCLNGKIFINSSAEVFPCMNLRKSRLGDLKKESVYSIFRRQKYKEFWNLSKNKIDSCKNCKYNLQCFDCRALDYYVTDKILGMKYCSYID